MTPPAGAASQCALTRSPQWNQPQSEPLRWHKGPNPRPAAPGPRRFPIPGIGDSESPIFVESGIGDSHSRPDSRPNRESGGTGIRDLGLRACAGGACHWLMGVLGSKLHCGAHAGRWISVASLPQSSPAQAGQGAVDSDDVLPHP
jgi:hypothetical protein